MLPNLKFSGLAMVVLLQSLAVPLHPNPHTSFPVLAQETTHQTSQARADQLLQQGIEQNQNSQFEAALQSWQQALAIYRDIGDRQGEANALNNLGLACRDLGQYTQSIEFHQRSLAIERQIGNRRGEAASLNNLGSTYNSLGQHIQAIKFHQRSLAIERQIGNRRGEAASLGNLGNAYADMGQYTQAIQFYQQQLIIARQIRERQSEANSLGNLGRMYKDMGEYAQAIVFHQQSLAIKRQIGDRQGEANSLGNLGLVYRHLGQHIQSIEFFRQALTIEQQIGDRAGEASALGSLGLAYYFFGKYNKSIEFGQQSLAIERQIGDRHEEGTSLNNIGLAYNALGQYTQAIQFYQQQLIIARQIGDRRGESYALGNLGLAHKNLGRYVQSIEFFQQSLAILRQIGDRSAEGISFSVIGDLLKEQNQPELAILLYKQSVNVRESIRKDLWKLSREEQQSYTQSVADTYRNLADLLLKQGRVMEALQVLDLLKVQELQDFFKDVKGNERTAYGIETLSEEQQILSRLDTANLNKYLKSASVTALVQQLQQMAPAQNLKLAAYIDLQTRLQKLGTDSALLYPLILDDRIELVLFTRNAPPIHRTTTIKQTELEQAVKSFRSAIQQKDSQNIRQPANQLYNWLIKPIEADLQQANIKTLIYAPDGQMRYVPLAALYDGKQWLVEKYEINYITALSLTNIATRSSQPPHILAGAFTDPAGRVQVNGQAFDFGAIPSALSEVKSLAKQFPNTTKLVYKDFNHASMTSDRLNRYNIVHLATHGKLVAGAPEDSFILLNNNEYITLREIKDWKLPNVALVVLSACQTALGDKLGSGIEIIGFGYQLQQAQARASIATLWEISDASTGSLMNEFYAQLQSKQLPPVEALREAQIALITSKNQTSGVSKPRTSVNYPSGQNQTSTINRDLSHPYYWAPFILIGNGL
ncbi:MAG: tetratricopeptide repeat protein [Leptolyngbya sp. BL-A-14]